MDCTEQGSCCAKLHKWGLALTELCKCAVKLTGITFVIHIKSQNSTMVCRGFLKVNVTVDWLNGKTRSS